MKSAITFLLLLAALSGYQFFAIDRPPFDHHNFRQCQTAATIELFAGDGIDLLHPRTNYVGEPGVFVLELPVFQAIGAVVYRASHGSLVPIRLLNILLTFGSAWGLWVLMRRHVGHAEAWLAVVLFLGSPLNQAYMGAILIDPMAVCLAMWAFVLGDLLLAEKTPPVSACVGFAICCVLGGLIKPLYLFPVGMLGLLRLVERRRLNRAMLAVGGSLTLAVVLVLLWNRHARLTNDASAFTRDIHPSSLLGTSQVLGLAFYRRVLHRLVFDVLGPLGGVLGLVGWYALLRAKTSEPPDLRRLAVVSLATVFGYWFCFANIIFPHDYYSLIVVPFCAIAASDGCTVLVKKLRFPWAPALGVCAALAGLGWFFKDGAFTPPPSLAEFAPLTAGRFEHGAYGMIFVGPEQSPGGVPIHESPAVLYAAGLLGTGLVVADAGQALERWDALRPGYRHLRYAVFWGVPVPERLANELGTPMVSIPKKKFVAYELPVAP